MHAMKDEYSLIRKKYCDKKLLIEHVEFVQ